MELIFVYNADSSPFVQVKDLIHKSVSPKTYGCRLCSLTFGTFYQKQQWSEFIKTLGIEAKFLHKDKFISTYPTQKSNMLPAVFIKKEKDLTLFISKEEIEKQYTLDDLINLVASKKAQILRES
ncbi:GTPase [Candidatus Curtissbacteria bacterium]|nr:GTPase [Candidatus Curtissbacteria bacterium]